MSGSAARGDRVRHPVYGVGSVLGRRAGGRVLVAFDDARELPRTVPHAELELVERDAMAATGGTARVESAAAFTPARPRPRPRARPGAEPPGAEDLPDLRQTMEALRLGVVPARNVLDYTVARAGPLESLAELLEAGRGFRSVWGDYGAGKTHLLDVAEQLARERGFATARIVMDPDEFPPSHPKRLYRAIVAALAYPAGGGHGIDPLMQRLVGSEDHTDPAGPSFSRFLSPYLFALRSGDDAAISWLRDHLSGDPVDVAAVNAALRRIGWRGPAVLAMSDFRTFGRMYVHLVGTLASWLRDAGYRGLVVLFDEVEFVEQLDAEHLAWAVSALKHFAAVAVPEGRLAFASAALYKGGQAVHRAIPLRYRVDQPLAVVFAFTPLDKIRALYRTMVKGEELSVTLGALGARDTPALIARILALYRRAYPGFAPPDSEVGKIRRHVLELAAQGRDSAREIVRGSVLLLDAARLTGARAAE